MLSDHQLSGFNYYLSIHPHIKSMMYVPLHCAIVIAVYLQCQQSKRPFSITLTGLYTCLAQTILMQYLQDHPDYAGKICQFNSFSELPPPVYTHFKRLCSLAFDGVDKQKLVFPSLPQSQDNLGILLDQQFEHLGFMNVVPELSLPSHQSTNYSYNFLHHSIQEYLAAYHISLMSYHEQQQLLQTVIGRHDDHLLNMVRFLAGITQLKHLDRKLVKKVIGITCFNFMRARRFYNLYQYRDEGEELPQYALEVLHECQDVNILDRFSYHVTIQSTYSAHHLMILGQCIAKSSKKWHVTFLDRGNFSGTENFCHSLKENSHPTYRIESIECCNCTPNFTHQILQHLPEYALKRIKKISMQHDDTKPMPPYWHQLERKGMMIMMKRLTVENVTATSVYWHEYKNEDYCQPLPPCLPEQILKMKGLNTLTLENVHNTSLMKLIPVLSRVPTLRNLQVSDVSNYFKMQYRDDSTCTIESANCTTELLDQLLLALPQQNIVCTELLRVNYKVGFYMYRCMNEDEDNFHQPLSPCLPKLIPRMERLTTLTLENVLDSSLTELIPALSQVPTLRNLTLHKLNSEGTALLGQWLPTCQLEKLTLFEKVYKVTTVTHVNKITNKIIVTFNNNFIEAIECQNCTTKFINQFISQLPQQLIGQIKTFTICNGKKCQYKYEDRDEDEDNDSESGSTSSVEYNPFALHMPEIKVTPRVHILPTPPCLPEVILKMERLNTLILEKVLGISLTELIPLLSKVPTLRNLTLHALNSEGIALLCQWLPICQLEKLIIYKEYPNIALPVEIMTVTFTNSIVCLNSTTEFIGQILQEMPQYISQVKVLTIHNDKIYDNNEDEQEDSCCTLPSLPPCLKELVPKMESLNTLTLKNVLNTSLTELIPVLFRVSTLRNLTLHELNLESIALLCQWLPTCQLETLTLYEQIQLGITKLHMKIVFYSNSIEVKNCTIDFLDQILQLMPIACITSLTIASNRHRYHHSQSLLLPSCLPELVSRMDKLNTLKLEGILDTSLTELILVLSRIPTLRNLMLHRLNSEGIALLCQWLATCQLETLTLPFLSPDHVEIVLRALTAVSSLKTLEIRGSKFTFQSMQVFVSMLQQNQSLTEINIMASSIESYSACYLGEALHHNTMLKKLDMRHNRVGERGALAMAEMLRQNTTLEILNLKYAEIDSKGAVSMAEALHHNITLRRLDMSGNQIGERGALAMAEMLEHNTTLEELDLNYTEIDNNVTVSLAKALHHNTTLRKLEIALNSVEDEGALAIAEMLKHNNTLQVLDLRDPFFSNNSIEALVESLTVNQHLKKLIISDHYEDFVTHSLPLYSAHKERVLFKDFDLHLFD